MKMTDQECLDLYHKANLAGREAALAMIPTPMHIQGYAPISEGACGFATVVIKPANCAFAKWLKKHHSTYPNYGGGLAYPIHDYNQSYDRKSAHAYAMAKVISEAGIRCHSESRLD